MSALKDIPSRHVISRENLEERFIQHVQNVNTTDQMVLLYKMMSMLTNCQLRQLLIEVDQ